MKIPLHGTRFGAFLAAVVVAGNILLQGSFSSANARIPLAVPNGVRLAGLRLQAAPDVAPLAEASLVGMNLPLTIAAPAPPSTIDLMRMEFSLTSELAAVFRRSAADPAMDFADAIFRGPESLLDGALLVVAGLFPRQDAFPQPGESSSITARLLDIQAVTGQGRLFSAFLSIWVEGEEHLLSRIADADFDTGGVEDLDAHELLRGQGKLLWDAVRQTYRSKFRFRGEDRIRDDAFRISDWQGADFVVLPPLMAGYVWWRGLEKRVSLGNTWLAITVEPPSRWFSGGDDLVAGFSVQWGIEGFPVGLILSVGKYDGTAELDFVGIGTSIAMVRQALGVRLGE